MKDASRHYNKTLTEVLPIGYNLINYNLWVSDYRPVTGYLYIVLITFYSLLCK